MPKGIKITECNVCNRKCVKNNCSSCPIYGYKKRNKLSTIEEWSNEEIDIILCHILLKNEKILDNILKLLPNRDMYNLIYLLQNKLRIGNKKMLVVMNCNYCNEMLFREMNNFLLQDRKFCNMDCRNKYKTKYGVVRGVNNGRYNSKDIKCTNCGNVYMSPKYIQEQTNSHGDNHHFCSQKCYWEYRSIYYIKEKSSFYGREITDIDRERSRQTCLNNMANGRNKKHLTKPHIKTNKILSWSDYNFYNEYIFKYYSMDIYIPDVKLPIEVMGDYYHNHPSKYPNIELLNDIQKKSLWRDKAKNIYIKKYYNLNILYLWESDINKNSLLCYLLINYYIENNGLLQNYHSFNYSVVNGNIEINKNIISTHQGI